MSDAAGPIAKLLGSAHAATILSAVLVPFLAIVFFMFYKSVVNNAYVFLTQKSMPSATPNLDKIAAEAFSPEKVSQKLPPKMQKAEVDTVLGQRIGSAG